MGFGRVWPLFVHGFGTFESPISSSCRACSLSLNCRAIGELSPVRFLDIGNRLGRCLVAKDCHYLRDGAVSLSPGNACILAQTVRRKVTGLKVLNENFLGRQTPLTLAETIDKQLLNAVSADKCDSDHASYRDISPRLLAIEKSRSAKLLRLSVPLSSGMVGAIPGQRLHRTNPEQCFGFLGPKKLSLQQGI